MAINDYRDALSDLNSALQTAGATTVAVLNAKKEQDAQQDALDWSHEYSEEQLKFAKEQWEYNKQLTEHNNQFNEALATSSQKLAQDTFNFNKDYTQNRYQYMVQDAQKAGLNPLAIAGGSVGSSVGSAQSPSSASVSSVPGSSAPGSSAMPSVVNALSPIAAASITSRNALRIARLETDAQKQVARLNAQTSRYVVDKETGTSDIMNSRTNQMNYAIASYKAQTDYVAQVRDIMSREHIAENDLRSREKLENARLSQQDKEFFEDFWLKALEQNRRFFSDEKYRDLYYQINHLKTLEDIKKLQSDIKVNWYHNISNTVLGVLGIGANVVTGGMMSGKINFNPVIGNKIGF